MKTKEELEEQMYAAQSAEELEETIRRSNGWIHTEKTMNYKFNFITKEQIERLKTSASLLSAQSQEQRAARFVVVSVLAEVHGQTLEFNTEKEPK